MGKTLSELDAIPESEFQEYKAFHDENPIGSWREDYRFAQLASFVTAGALKKPLKAEDIMVFWKQANEEQDVDDILSGAVLING